MKEIRSAIKAGDLNRVLALLEADPARIHIMTPFGTWLHVAASEGQLEIVKKLLDLGMDVNAHGGILGGGPLTEAVSGGHIEIVRYLLSRGAELDVSNAQWNPLFSAIYVCRPDIAKLLIDSGIDTRKKYSGASATNMDALAYATERGQVEIAEMLREIP